MKNLFKIFITFFLAWLLLSLPTCGGQSSPSSTAPVSIPAPVSGLISVSSPNKQGNATIRGIKGAVTANASIMVTNKTSSVTATANADSNGTFHTDIAASIGDSIGVTQAVNSSTSNETASTIPENVPAVASIPIETVVDSFMHEAYVGTTDGTNTLLYAIDLDTLVVADAITVSNTVLSGFDFDVEDLEYYLADMTNDKVEIRDSSGDLIGSALSIENPIDVATNPNFLQHVVVGQQSSTSSVTIIDNTGAVPVIDDAYLIGHPTVATATHTRTYVVDADTSLAGASRIAVLSEFSNGHTVFSFIDAANDTLIDQVNLGSGTFIDMMLFNDASEAVISREDNDKVIHLTSVAENFSVAAQITVGDSPRGLTVDEIGDVAFVVNYSDNSASLIDLSNDTVAATFTTANHNVGLGPVDITLDIDDTLGIYTALVASGDGQTLNFIDVRTALGL